MNSIACKLFQGLRPFLPGRGEMKEGALSFFRLLQPGSSYWLCKHLCTHTPLVDVIVNIDWLFVFTCCAIFLLLFRFKSSSFQKNAPFESCFSQRLCFSLSPSFHLGPFFRLFLFTFRLASLNQQHGVRCVPGQGHGRRLASRVIILDLVKIKPRQCQAGAVIGSYIRTLS